LYDRYLFDNYTTKDSAVFICLGCGDGIIIRGITEVAGIDYIINALMEMRLKS
jgi:pyruvate/2-oxoacid:ferredoxin oxidoreductase beta subunit